jgi:hypothetical protein
MNNKRQPSYKRFETPLDRKAKIDEQLRRRELIERSYMHLNTEDDDIDDYEDPDVRYSRYAYDKR